jgi:glycerol uptake facilitator-like aquaporin
MTNRTDTAAAPATARQLVAEGLGTAFLLATVVGSGIMAERLSDGNVALALLANTIATGAILAVLILVFGAISGAHFNPAVTLAFRLRGEIGPAAARAYVVVQIIGGLLGTWAAHVMFDERIFQLSTTPRSGFPQWTAEFIAAFGLVATILGCLRARPEAVPYAVGLFITAGYWFTASTSFANPAVTIARSLTDTFSGIRPVDAPGFIVAQLLGATAATLVFRWLLAPQDSPAAD